MSLDNAVAQLVEERFSQILEQDLVQEILKVAKSKNIEEDELLIDIGDNIDFLPLVIKGSLKILTEDKEGRELLLYYLESGDTCAVTINCCTKASKSKVRAVAESPCTVLMIPIDLVESWMARFSSWRSFILETYNYRMNEMLAAIDNLAFNNMEERIMNYLRDKVMVTGNKTLAITHNEIANDLHSSRVVISRVMKKLETDGLISQKRNVINLAHL
ncbi:MAG: helix-turn-helix domain-containing protein [Bacteroidetes bacterium]|nr:helix-turn-helix domain-containing protein [Bacteroidota bacterium]